MKDQEMPKKVWVLYGGLASEREVSLRTTDSVAEALKKSGFEVELFDVLPGKLGILREGFSWSNPPDIVFLGLHGRFGEDGTLQGFLEGYGIPYVGSGVYSSALCYNKAATKTLLAKAGLATPEGYVIKRVELESFLESQKTSFYEQKWFIKPSREGSTVGVERFEPYQHSDPSSAFKSLAQNSLCYDDAILVEEWIQGKELTVALLDSKALPIVEIRPKSQFYDYSSKYTAGMTEYFCPADLPASLTKEIMQIAEKAFEVLECRDYGRLDIMLDAQNRPKILEMNTLPGMTKTSLVPKAAKAAGLEFSDFIKTLVLESYRRQRGSQRNT